MLPTQSFSNLHELLEPPKGECTYKTGLRQSAVNIKTANLRSEIKRKNVFDILYNKALNLYGSFSCYMFNSGYSKMSSRY